MFAEIERQKDYMILHVFRVYLTDGFKKSRKLTWVTMHTQVLITSWVVIAILLISTILIVRNPQTIPCPVRRWKFSVRNADMIINNR
ncbi:transmembrane protein, putative [Medicago truncatula]|uniref:Transmembrane protein, putative n=1 Tax=Medicago truncatula TaxID=3880 RepID=G7K1Z6_MEDTR|nr:transmembrane protein, putative [Medicago truncatula]